MKLKSCARRSTSDYDYGGNLTDMRLAATSSEGLLQSETGPTRWKQTPGDLDSPAANNSCRFHPKGFPLVYTAHRAHSKAARPNPATERALAERARKPPRAVWLLNKIK
jgi:hypothetical protein